MSNYLLTIAYDGSGFHGWQRQPSERTVQGHLETTFSRLFNRDIKLNGTSRTDAGVHALGQRASFVADLGIPTERLARVMNNALCGWEEGGFAMSPVRIVRAEEVPEGFHARFDCKGKKYIYRINCGETDIFRRNYVYHVNEGRGREPSRNAPTALTDAETHAAGGGVKPCILDIDAMNEAAGLLIGTHDFKSFEAAGGTPRESTIRTIFEAKAGAAAGIQGIGTITSWPADEIVFEISGDGFLYNMVRIITGTLVEVGLGKRSPDEIKTIIEAKDRAAAGHTAPPYGLYLKEVYY